MKGGPGFFKQRFILRQALRCYGNRAVQTDTTPQLSAVEERVLDLFSEGWSRDEIARSLAISANTVGHHLTRAKERLSARTLPHAVMLHVLRSREAR
jgi:DNA-binding CsgD family transcriptional regulator